MAAYYKSKGISLYNQMQNIYKQYGMFLNSLLNFNFEGAAGMQKMSDMMTSLRNNPPKEIAGEKVLTVSDYLQSTCTDTESGSVSEIKLPKSNVLSFRLPGGSGVIVRPSGTEPKIKIYITAVAADRASAEDKTKLMSADMEKILGI